MIDRARSRRFVHYALGLYAVGSAWLALIFLSGAELTPRGLTCGLAYGGEPADSTSDSATTGEDYLRALAARNKELRTLAVSFRQEKKLRILRRPRLSQGQLWYAGGRLAMEVRDPGGKVETRLLVDKTQLQIYYPRLKRLEVADGLGEGGDDPGAPAIPFAPDHWTSLAKNYHVTLERFAASEGDKKEERVTLRLRARAEETAIQQMRIVLIDDQLREYVQVEKSGDEMRMEIVSWKANEPVDPARFELKVPRGTKRVKITR